MRAASRAARGVPLLCVCLSGCTGLFHSTAQPEQIYYLRALPAGATAGATAAAAPRTGVSLRIARPSTAPGLDSPHIILVQADRRMNFYAGSRWPTPLPDVVEALAADSLRASGAWLSVEDSSSPFPSDYLLQLSVQRFEADYTATAGAAPVAEVVIDCTLGRREGRDVIAAFVASGSAPAAANRLSAVVAAFEQAANTALATLSQQAAQAASRDAGRADAGRTQKAEKPEPSNNRQSQ